MNHQNLLNIEMPHIALRPSVSIAIIAYNEEGNIRDAVKFVVDSLLNLGFNDYELILVDGGSSDGTPEIMAQISKEYDNIKVTNSWQDDGQKGLGKSFITGLKLATKEYYGWFPGDNETLPETVKNILESLGKADIIIPYTVNPWVRSLLRRVLSVIYTKLYNISFSLKLKYFNGPCFFRKEVLNKVQITTIGPSYMAEVLVQLLKKYEISYIEVPMYIKAREYGKSSVLKWKNVYLIGKNLINLFFRIHFGR